MLSAFSLLHSAYCLLVILRLDYLSCLLLSVSFCRSVSILSLVARERTKDDKLLGCRQAVGYLAPLCPILPSTFCSSPTVLSIESEMRSSIILSLVALAASSPVSQQLEERNHDGPFPMPLCQGVDINRLSVSQAQDYFKSGKLSVCTVALQAAL